MARDTGEAAWVPPEKRLDVDEGSGANALEGGPDDEDLEAIYADPGEIWEGDVGTVLDWSQP